MSNIPSSGRQAFDISDWRRSVKDRREVVRSIILKAVIGGEQLEPLLNDLKKSLGFDGFDDADRNLFHVTLHDIRTVVGGWRSLSPQEQRAFAAGKGAPSSVAIKIRKAA